MSKFNAAMLAGLVACTGGSVSVSNTPPTLFLEEEPNDSWQDANVAWDAKGYYQLEGNIHHTDIDHWACGLPTIDGHRVDVHVEYAAGWDMEVQIVWIDNSGVVHNLHGMYDEFGVGNMSATVDVPAGAGWVGMTIRHTQTPQPDETRYTFTVEVF